MKNFALFSLATMLFITACTKDHEKPTPETTNTQTVTATVGSGAKFKTSTEDYSQPIAITEANRMIQSYLTSINYPNNESDLRSLTFDADTLRAYLNDTSRGKIKTLKLMVAHQPAYASSSYGMNAGMRADAITLVIVGLDENDKYIYNARDMVYDHFLPCPSTCNESGTLLTN